MKVTSTIEPVMTGTLIETPSNFPARPVITFVTAIAAPVDEGTMFIAAALPSRQSFLFGASTRAWLAVYPCTVLRIAFSIPIASSMIEITGLAALVVQDALEERLHVERESSFNPMRTVTPSTVEPGSSFAGAERTTRLAPAFM